MMFKNKIPDLSKKKGLMNAFQLGKALGVSPTTEQVAQRLEPIAGKVLSNRRILDYVKAGKLNSEQSGNRTARFFSEADYAEFEIYYRNLTGK